MSSLFICQPAYPCFPGSGADRGKRATNYRLLRLLQNVLKTEMNSAFVSRPDVVYALIVVLARHNDGRRNRNRLRVNCVPNPHVNTPSGVIVISYACNRFGRVDENARHILLNVRYSLFCAQLLLLSLRNSALL